MSYLTGRIILSYLPFYSFYYLTYFPKFNSLKLSQLINRLMSSIFEVELLSKNRA
jgi:hypothetical protein